MTSPTTVPDGRGTTRERVAAEIRAEIVDGTLAPGVPLRTEELMRRLGVSSTPLREAFVQLQGEGLVTVTANRGATVTSITRQDASDLIQVASLLWDAVCRWTVPVLDSPTVDSLKRSRVNFGLAMRSGDLSGAILDTEQFQTTLLNACWSTELVRSVQAVRPRQQRLFRLMASFPVLEPYRGVHDAVIAAAGTSDVAPAAEAFRDAWTALEAATRHSTATPPR